jgi:hypothetical protein
MHQNVLYCFHLIMHIGRGLQITATNNKERGSVQCKLEHRTRGSAFAGSIYQGGTTISFKYLDTKVEEVKVGRSPIPRGRHAAVLQPNKTLTHRVSEIYHDTNFRNPTFIAVVTNQHGRQTGSTGIRKLRRTKAVLK